MVAIFAAILFTQPAPVSWYGQLAQIHTYHTVGTCQQDPKTLKYIGCKIEPGYTLDDLVNSLAETHRQLEIRRCQ